MRIRFLLLNAYAVGGTVRTFSVEATDRIEEGLRRIATGIAQAHGCTAEVFFRRASPPVVNHDAEARFAAETMREVVGNAMVDDNYPAVMGAEDFAYVLGRVPGALAFVGARPEGLDPDTAPPNHSNRVVFDESAMATGVAVHVGIAHAVLAR